MNFKRMLYVTCVAAGIGMAGSLGTGIDPANAAANGLDSDSGPSGTQQNGQRAA